MLDQRQHEVINDLGGHWFTAADSVLEIDTGAIDFRQMWTSPAAGQLEGYTGESCMGGAACPAGQPWQHPIQIAGMAQEDERDGFDGIWGHP
ncbi:hypothetical protein DDE84_10405 [Bifidobacterium tibiigranuli]|uniref:Uncharacterized protein n=1 Tax=Bifidobacterium tibiigranuli TaxID=2172043 RepID=A0A5N6RYR2_9BIFI|nr:hypothetical protein DDE84_10405 [Bifidobacterium tibiigranuli]